MYLQRCAGPVDVASVTPPRQIEKGQMCFVTARAVNRSYRFVPTPAVCLICWFCLAVTSLKYAGRVVLHEFLFMSNHYHLVLTDVDGVLPDFMRDLNSLLSRALNALRGTQGTNIEGYDFQVIADAGAAIRSIAYLLANPCAANVVERSRHWRGVSSLELEYGVARETPRPSVGLWSSKVEHASRSASQRSGRAAYAGRCKFPALASLILVRPAILQHLEDHELRAHIREQVDAVERKHMVARKEERVKVLGWHNVVRKSFTYIPASGEELFASSPTVMASDPAERVRFEEQRAAFVQAYYVALERFRAGEREVVFPRGTWLMRRRFNARCALEPPV